MRMVDQSDAAQNWKIPTCTGQLHRIQNNGWNVLHWKCDLSPLWHMKTWYTFTCKWHRALWYRTNVWCFIIVSFMIHWCYIVCKLRWWFPCAYELCAIVIPFNHLYEVSKSCTHQMSPSSSSAFHILKSAFTQYKPASLYWSVFSSFLPLLSHTHSSMREFPSNAWI